jgi:hypothetical protein
MTYIWFLETAISFFLLLDLGFLCPKDPGGSIRVLLARSQ